MKQFPTNFESFPVVSNKPNQLNYKKTPKIVYMVVNNVSLTLYWRNKLQNISTIINIKKPIHINLQ